MKTVGLLDVDIHPNFRILMEHKTFLSIWCMTFMHTREKDVFFLNALKKSLAPTPQEGSFHVMFVRKQYTQEPEEPEVYDWNHLSLSVAVPTKPTSKFDRELNLTQSHFVTQTKRCERDSQNATKITSAPTDTCIECLGFVISTLVKTLYLSLILMTIFLTVCHRPFLPAL